ncbi:glycine cleavage system aminomethyltransferase GcvT [Solirubrobacter phytolaccae]|uniref:Aminomethyltransferase n=1 Tax=Solirubrobacter phytolaccae TaxID=1404360 RepID=A0A9X3S8P4_9ACTN|nr:glycine cleavage system aminomethyltransferase GcvT [Solirubrobacter phytolaccae]MDA0182449.1 glycine cleavage system aminomethyltransferase GcvT [Solirubrobacter phytolaccae]
MAIGSDTTLLKTALYDRHVAAGAKLVPFAGWEMPVQYAGIKEEHLAVRTKAGVFDVSHMGEIETEGPQALEFLQRILSNDVAKIADNGAQYSVLCKEDGGVLDDLFTYKLGEGHYLTVTNAANHAKDLAWFTKQAESFDVTLHDRLHDYAMLAVQGPEARGIVAGLTDGELPKRFRTARLTVAGVADVLVCGTGYTGEDGVELLVGPEGANVIWDALLAAGVAPIGLAARDTLRLEVCYHLYGNDLMESRGPIEAGLGWCVKEDTGFIGAEAIKVARANGPSELLVPFVTEQGIARQGNAVIGGGEVTSGTLSPSLNVGIGMAYVPIDKAEPGTKLEIDVRGRTRAAEVREKPLYTKES